jgi:hypothetical protein
MICCHNGKGPSQDFQDEMTSLWKGFSRTANKKKMTARRQPRHKVDNVQGDGGNGDNGDNGDDGDDDDDDESESFGSDLDDDEDDDDRKEFYECKEPMSAELYQIICKWLLEWGNLDRVFAALFIVLSWNLVCCGKNIAKIWFSHLKWSVFDAMQVNFKHTKVDQ